MYGKMSDATWCHRQAIVLLIGKLHDWCFCARSIIRDFTPLWENFVHITYLFIFFCLPTVLSTRNTLRASIDSRGTYRKCVAQRDRYMKRTPVYEFLHFKVSLKAKAYIHTRPLYL